MLAVQPELGRSAAELAPDLRRSEYQHHVAFYVSRAGGVRIVRVLHESMDVKRHLEG
jgi:toxin ParE1/3/4